MSSTAFSTRRFLALYLPLLSAERTIASGVASPDETIVFVSRKNNSLFVQDGSATAVDRNLIGLSLADARAREPTLTVHHYDPGENNKFVQKLKMECEHYSPIVDTTTDTISIDLTGCPSALDEAGLIADIRRRFARHGTRCVHAFAATAEGAMALARSGGSTETLPPAALKHGAAYGLHQAGLHTLGDLAKIPRATLAARFGKAVPAELARLLGQETVPISRPHPPTVIVQEHRFADPVTSVDQILKICGKLIDQAAKVLEQRRQGGRRYDILVFRSDGDVRRLTIATAQPTRNTATVARLLVERIDSLNDPLDPGFGYDAVRLVVAQAELLTSTQLDFDTKDGAGDSIAALIDRLTTRLGADRVRSFAHGNSYLPELASYDQPASAADRSSPRSGKRPPRPLHLFTPPEPIDVVAEVPDAPPRWFRWRRVKHVVQHAEGPERIASEWWRHGNDSLTRDYYRLEDSEGRRFWVFRHGLYGFETGQPQWYLHGRFA